ncbi:hypothetical protein [Enterovibrio norvegicus]|nr:hypothetical protein [Enterovibrio norvegicus]
MRLTPKNVALVAGISALTASAIIFAVNNNVAGLQKVLGKSGWF